MVLRVWNLSNFRGMCFFCHYEGRFREHLSTDLTVWNVTAHWLPPASSPPRSQNALAPVPVSVSLQGVHPQCPPCICACVLVQLPRPRRQGSPCRALPGAVCSPCAALLPALCSAVLGGASTPAVACGGTFRLPVWVPSKRRTESSWHMSVRLCLEPRSEMAKLLNCFWRQLHQLAVPCRRAESVTRGLGPKLTSNTGSVRCGARVF